MPHLQRHDREFGRGSVLWNKLLSVTVSLRKVSRLGFESRTLGLKLHSACSGLS